MGKKAKKQRRDSELRLAEITDRFEEVSARAQRDGEAVAEKREAFEVSARDVRARVVELDEELAETRRAVEHSLAVLSDLEAQGRARVAEIDAVAGESVARFDTTFAVLDDFAARGRARVAEIDAVAGESVARFDTTLAELGDRAAAQVGDEIARHSIEARGRLESSLRSVDEQADDVGAQLRARMTEILDAANQDVGEARAQARFAIDDAVASVQLMAREASDRVAPPAPTPLAVTGPLEWHDAGSAAATPTDAPWQESGVVPPDEVASAADDNSYTAWMATELRDDSFQHHYQPGAVAVAAEPAADDSGTATVAGQRPEPVVENLVRRPVHVRVPLAALTGSLGVLARYAADERVRIEVVHVAASGRPAAFLRLTAYNVAGWWEYHDISVRADSKEPNAALVSLGELTDALDLVQPEGDGSEVVLQLAGDLTIGNVLLRDHPGLDPVLPYHRERIEHVDLGAADRTGLHVETQIGRVFIPPRLISFLRTRNYCSSEILLVEDAPCLAAQISGPAEGTSATIVTRLGEHAPNDETTAERRNAAGSEVSQLVRALSADTTAEELEQVLAHGVGYVRRRAAAHRALRPDVIHDLIAEGTEAMRAAAASNPSLSDVTCAAAAADASEIVRAAVAANPSASAECLAQLAKDPVAPVRERVASNANVTQELLARLAEDTDSAVRAAAAAQPGLEPEAFFTLAHDPDPRVCAAVAHNPACPSGLLGELLELVPEAVLANPSTPAALLAAGSRVDSRDLRTAVAANPATPAKQLQALARDPDPAVVLAVAENPTTPANVRRRARRRLSGAPESPRP